MSVRVLHIDDDPRFAALVAEYLGQNGVSVTHCPDGGRGLSLLDAQSFDAVLLDVMMPGLDGLEVVRRIRTKHTVPVLMLTAKGDETDRVVGLELGADDYLAKPFSPRELLARIRAVLRRAQPDAVAATLVVGDLRLDATSRTATRGEVALDLTGVEFDLLLALARRAGRVITREALLATAGRDDGTVSERTVDVHISHLRQKLGDDPRSPRRIKTLRGVGYVLVRDAE